MATPSWVTGASDNSEEKNIKKSAKPSWVSDGEIPAAPSEEVSYGAGLTRAGLQGLSFGFADEIEAFLRKGDMPYEEKLAQVRQAIDQFSEQNPGTALTAEIVGSLPTALLGGAGLARAGVTGAAKVAGLEGALYGFGSGEGGAAERAKSAAIGGTVGAVTGKASDFLFPKLSKAATELAKKGVRLTPGQRMGGKTKLIEERLTSVPFAGDIISDQQAQAMADFNRAEMNEALKVLDDAKPRFNSAVSLLKPKTKVPKNLSGNEAFEFANSVISDAYDEVVPKMSVNLNEAFENDLISIVRKNEGLGPDGLQKFQSKLEAIFGRTGKQGVKGSVSRDIGGSTLKSIDSDLGTEIANYSRSPIAAERDLGAAMREVQTLLRDSMESSNPDVMKDYKKAQMAWRSLLPVRRAVANATAKSGEFTPKQLLQASKAVDKSKDRLATAKGQGIQQPFAQKAQEVLGQTVGDMGTADRAALMLMAQQGFQAPLRTLAGGGALTLGAGAMYRNPLGRAAATGLLAAPGALGRQAAPVTGAMTGRAFEEDQQ